MRIKQQIPVRDRYHAVLQDVENHFKGRLLPRQWDKLVLAAVQPCDMMISSTSAELGELFYKSFTDDADLTLEILNYARECGRKYIPNNSETQAQLVRAMLLCDSYSDLFHGAPKPIKDMADKEIAEWINGIGFRTKVTAASVRTARQAISKSRPKKKN